MPDPTVTRRQLPSELLETSFLTGSAESIEAYRAAMSAAQENLVEYFATRPNPYSGAGIAELADTLGAEDPCPEDGVDLEEVLRGVGESVLAHSLGVSHPACAAHLHCPPLVAALAAEAMICVTNQSMDSWDQSPAATLLEERMVAWLCDLFGYGEAGGGVFTSGGTQSNFMGLLLARDRYSRERLGWSVREEGLPSEADRFRILCSETAHFTVRKSAAQLGLGEKAVVPVEADAGYRMNVEALDRRLGELRREELLPIVLVGTAGNTDFGSVDPLPELALRAREHGLWFHVDAAYGGALMMSDRHRGKLRAIESADSIAVDFHKQFYQPISASAFLLKNRSDFGLMELHADYLNPEEDEAANVPNLVTKSVQTSRRFDALKLFVSLRALGRKNLAAMIDHTVELASETARAISSDPALELVSWPEMNAVTFRYLPRTKPAGPDEEAWANEINDRIWASLLSGGEAVLARTRVGGFAHLKFTLLNPRTSMEHVEDILEKVKTLGGELEKEMIEEKTLTNRQIAERATMQSFLNCYLRETGTGEVLEACQANESIEGTATVRVIRCKLPRQGAELLAPVHYLSPTGRHLFRFPFYYRPEKEPGLTELDLATLTNLLTKELMLDLGRREAEREELLLRVTDSCRNVERFVRARREDRDRLYDLESRFIDTEQALVFGHHFHPTPKSRQDMSESDLETYSPELEGRFRLHYFRAHPSIVREGSALQRSATDLIKDELSKDPEVDEAVKAAYCGDDAHSLIPAHPWQAEFLLRKPEVRGLVEKGLLEHLGPLGSPYLPTSSVRTVYRADAEFMLKLSLNVKITNSVRANLNKELRRGIKVCRVLESEIGRELSERHPRFGIVRDPAYVTIDVGGGEESGFEVVLRENPFGGAEQPDATPVIALCQDHIYGEGSRLARLVRHLSEKEERPTQEVSLDWFRRYLDVSLRPILWFYFTHGLAVEAHQQNSVLVLEDGYPKRFFYRDNQGYYFNETMRKDFERRLPSINDIEDDTVVSQEVTDERLRYYFFINNLFGLINAFGVAGLADEKILLAELRSVLEELDGSAPESSTLIPSLLNEKKLPGKANLLTRLHDMDELLGDLATQSVYVEIDNPLVRESR